MEYKNYLQIFAVWTERCDSVIMQKQNEDAIIERFYNEIKENADDIINASNTLYIASIFPPSKF